MSSSTQMDEETLARLDYHWLWGIRYKNTPKLGNLGAEVRRLIDDEQSLKAIIKQQRSIDEKPVFIVFFYWLFNISNYAYNRYVLAARQLHLNYLSSHLKDSPAMSKEPGFIDRAVQALKNFPTSTAEATSSAYESASNALASFTARWSWPPSPATSAPGGFPAKQEQRQARTINTDTINVTQEMKPHLETLGIHLEIGSVITRREFRTKCLPIFREFHSDKEGGEDNEFIRIRAAYDSLVALFDRPEHEAPDNNYWPDFNAQMESIFTRLDRLDSGIAELQAMTRQREESDERRINAAEETIRRAKETAREADERITRAQDRLNELRRKRGVLTRSDSSPSPSGSYDSAGSDADDEKNSSAASSCESQRLGQHAVVPAEAQDSTPPALIPVIHNPQRSFRLGKMSAFESAFNAFAPYNIGGSVPNPAASFSLVLDTCSSALVPVGLPERQEQTQDAGIAADTITEEMSRAVEEAVIGAQDPFNALRREQRVSGDRDAPTSPSGRYDSAESDSDDEEHSSTASISDCERLEDQSLVPTVAAEDIARALRPATPNRHALFAYSPLAGSDSTKIDSDDDQLGVTP